MWRHPSGAVAKGGTTPNLSKPTNRSCKLMAYHQSIMKTYHGGVQKVEHATFQIYRGLHRRQSEIAFKSSALHEGNVWFKYLPTPKRSWLHRFPKLCSSRRSYVLLNDRESRECNSIWRLQILCDWSSPAMSPISQIRAPISPTWQITFSILKPHLKNISSHLRHFSSNTS